MTPIQKIRSQGDESQLQLLIIPCDCRKYPGRVVSSAARVLEEKGEVCVLSPPVSQDDIDSVDRSIAVDGCEAQCVKKMLDTLYLESEFYLQLGDLGIEDAGVGEVTRDDLQLAVDGIVACSTRVSGGVPKIPGCCCCS